MVENKVFTGLFLEGLEDIKWIKQNINDYYYILYYKDGKRSEIIEIKDINFNTQSPLITIKDNITVNLDQLDGIEVYYKMVS